MTPFKALYRRDPPSRVKYETGSTTNAELELQLQARDASFALLREHLHKQHLHKAQQVMKQRADGHRREVSMQWAIGSSSN